MTAVNLPVKSGRKKGESHAREFKRGWRSFAGCHSGGSVSTGVLREEADNCLDACIAQRLAAAGCPLGNCLSPVLSIMPLLLPMHVHERKNILT